MCPEDVHRGPEYRTLTTGRLKQLILWYQYYIFYDNIGFEVNKHKLCNCRNFNKHCCINELTQKWHTGYSKKSYHTSKGLFTKKLFLKMFLTYTLSLDTWLSFVDFFWTSAYCTTSSVVCIHQTHCYVATAEHFCQKGEFCYLFSVECLFECGFESPRNSLGWLILAINCGFFLLDNKCKYKLLHSDFISSRRICNITIFQWCPRLIQT